MATMSYLKRRARIPLGDSLLVLGLPRATYFRWARTGGKRSCPRVVVPKANWLLPEERRAIVSYKRKHPKIGYRRLAYMMLDEGVAAVTPSSVYRVLREAGLSSRWTRLGGGGARKRGFDQPLGPHRQWHTDIAYLNILGTHYFFLGVLDGYSRAIVHHEVRQDMTTADVEIVIERALAKLPPDQPRPRLITDNGGQYVSVAFKAYLRERDISHSRARVRHPQSNGKMERFHRTLKGECIRVTAMGSLNEARRLIAQYVRGYNDHRLHSALNYLRPADYLKGSEHVAHCLAKRREALDSAAKRRRRHWMETRKRAVVTVASDHRTGQTLLRTAVPYR